MPTIRRIKKPILIALAALLLLVPLTVSASTAHSGDPSGDGAITISDYTMTRLHILSLQTLDADAAQAADVNGDGSVTISDYTLLRLHILGRIDITQGDALLPLLGCVIGLDPGHQEHANRDYELISPTGTEKKHKVSSGTYGRWTGIREYEMNLDIGLALRDRLEALGATVIMTRTTHDVDISNSERAIMMNNVPVDCWLRIHADGSSNPEKHGMSYLAPVVGCMNTTDPSVQTNSAAFAQIMLNAGIAATGAYDRGVRLRDDQTGFCWSSVPVCTVEMGYMTNETEDLLMATDAYRQKLVNGMVEGFLTYFGE